MANKKFFDVDNLDLGTDGKVEQQEVPDLTAGVGIAKKAKSAGIEPMYDKYKKDIFLFDISGSMGDGMLPDEINQMYFWNDEVIQQFIDKLRENARSEFMRRAIGEWQKPTDADIDAKFKSEVVAMLIRAAMMEGDEDEDPADFDPAEIEREAEDDFAAMSQSKKDDWMFFLAYGLDPVIGQDMKYYIVRQQLDRTLNIKLIKVPGVTASSKAKMDVMKDAARQFVTARFDKYPDAQVLAYEFDDRPTLISTKITKDDLLNAVDRMHPAGGTNIFAAVDIAIREFRARPSGLKAHHIVLVTDAETHEGVMVEKDLFPQMKDQNIVFDFIQIKGAHTLWGGPDAYSESIDALKRICTATGGEFTLVNTPSEFTQMFLAAANRLALPPKR